MTTRKRPPVKPKPTTPPSEITVAPQTVLEIVQQDPTGALLVKNAVQQIVIAQQQEMIEGLQTELVSKAKGADNGEAVDKDPV